MQMFFFCVFFVCMKDKSVKSNADPSTLKCRLCGYTSANRVHDIGMLQNEYGQLTDFGGYYDLHTSNLRTFRSARSA